MEKGRELLREPLKRLVRFLQGHILGVTIFGIVTSIVASGIYDSLRDTLKQRDHPGGEAKEIIGQLLAVSERPTIGTERMRPGSELIDSATETLRKNPYNFRALMMRGQFYCVFARSGGGSGYRQAAQDFEAAIKVEPDSADPHYGLGSIYYELALLDLASRELYDLRDKGMLVLDPESGIKWERLPRIAFSPDRRSSVILGKALSELQEGKGRKQEFDESFALYDPREIDAKLRAVRILMGMEPGADTDGRLLLDFILVASQVVDGGLDKFINPPAERDG